LSVLAAKVANSKTNLKPAGPKVKIAKSDGATTLPAAVEAFTEAALVT
jgi:hypothetical protein